MFARGKSFNNSSPLAKFTNFSKQPFVLILQKRNAKVFGHSLKEEFVPTYKHAIETFLDAFGVKELGVHWNVKSQKNEELHHWTDNRFSNSFVRNGNATHKKQVARVKIDCEEENKARFVEVHFDQRILLAYEHDFTGYKKNYSESNRALIEKNYDNLRRLFNSVPATLQEYDAIYIPEECDPLAAEPIYLGLDIPAVWLTMFKTVKWCELYVPEYLDQVNYFEFFRNSPLMDRLRENNTIGTNEENFISDAFLNTGGIHDALAEKVGVNSPFADEL